MPVYFRSALFASYILNSETYSRKYEIMPNISTHACKKIYRKHEFVENMWPANSALFIYVYIASKQLNSLTAISTLSWLGGVEVSHPLWVPEPLVQLPAPPRVGFFVLLLMCFYFFV